MKVIENAVFKKSMCITYYRSLQMQYEGKLKLVFTLQIKENFKLYDISFLCNYKCQIAYSCFGDFPSHVYFHILEDLNNLSKYEICV